MRRFVLFLLVFCLGGLAPNAGAEIVVLIHGYLADARSWERSGVNTMLAERGWPRAGIIEPGFQGPVLPPPAVSDTNKVYSIELPSTAPLAVQSDILIRALRMLEARHPGEKISLAGHSAGGVVARMALVRGGAGKVHRLITIASPHLGTERALEALDKTQGGGPFGMVKDMFGGGDYHAVKRSWPVLLDLAPAQPGNALHGLNLQPHPDLQYVSIVRGNAYGSGDELVPGFSQEMNNVPQLHGKSKTYVVPAEHGLVPPDGNLLSRILSTR
jgi:pimeloyl-ACP methyl ester carboxylesterase